MTREDKYSICLIGAGNMGGALLGGWLNEGIDPEAITVIDPSPADHMKDMISNAGVRHESAAPADLNPDILMLAVKPQIIDNVVAAIGHMVGQHTVVVSIAAGKTIAQLEEGIGKVCAVVRAMPNTPALVKRGITVACPNSLVTDLQKAHVERLLLATGSVEWVTDEHLINAVTGVSGSGPAYVFYLAECMALAGIQAGLSEDLARKLASETVSGAGELLARSDKEPHTLRENVTSPNGTTAAALEVLMGDDGMRQIVEEAVLAATQRSRELSDG
ncbi:MAG: pyrroline-5-carboxylate reductase [Pseudomonadota bacterium]